MRGSLGNHESGCLRGTKHLGQVLLPWLEAGPGVPVLCFLYMELLLVIKERGGKKKALAFLCLLRRAPTYSSEWTLNKMLLTDRWWDVIEVWQAGNIILIST